MSYDYMARLEVLSAINNISSEAEFNEFRNMIALFFADKARKEIEKLWEEGRINEETINQWGAEHMRTPYRYAEHRS